MKIAELARRVVFFVALAVLCYSLELMWQHHQRSTSDHSVESHEKIVFIGGSASVGLAPVIERNLRTLVGRDDIDVVDMSDFMMSIDEAITRAKRAVRTHRPKLVLFMIGMNEFSIEREWSQKARSLLEAGKKDEFVEHIFASVENDRVSPTTFIYLSWKEIDACDCRDELAEMAQAKIDDFVPRATHEVKHSMRVLELLRLAQVISLAKRAVSAPDAEKAILAFRERFVSLFTGIEKWRSDVRTMDYASFVADGRPSEDEKYLRSWFWYTWTRDGRHNDADPVLYYTEHASDLVSVLQIPLSVKRKGGLEAIFPEPGYRAVVSAMLAELRDTMSRQDDKSIRDDLFESFDLADLASLARRSENGMRLALVHYPGYRLPLIDAMARKFDLPVIGTKSKLGELVRKNGHYHYFYDRLKGTGHLTDVGLEVYGREIAEELSKL